MAVTDSSRLAAPLRPSGLRSLGPFRVEALIGRGGMGFVFRGRGPEGRPVALKVLSVRSPTDRRAVRRFLREARLLRRLAHPAVPRILALGRAGSLYYLATEYVEGATLAELLDRGRRFSLGEALRIVRDAGDALAAAHRVGVLHRDVTSRNIMLDRRGGVHVLDFGIAREAAACRRRRLTYVGTPEYASPEQLRGDPLDVRTDIYSLGVVLWELLRGEPPFPAAATVAVYRAKLRGFRPAAGDGPVPRPAARLLRRFLAPRPWRRFRSMAQAVAAVEAVRRRGTRPRPRWARA